MSNNSDEKAADINANTPKTDEYGERDAICLFHPVREGGI